MSWSRNSKDDLLAVMLYTISNGACQPGTERKRLQLRQERDMNEGDGETENSG